MQSRKELVAGIVQKLTEADLDQQVKADASAQLSRPLDCLAREIREINRNNGWNTTVPEDWNNNEYKVPAILMLIVSELAEALEEYRSDDREKFATEMADTVIRCLDLMGGLCPDFDEVVYAKLAKNRNRGYRHGGKRV